MENEKGTKPPVDDEFDGGNSTRARNRTVMLTPDITGQVRARLAQELSAPPGGDVASTGGFQTPMGAGAVPAARPGLLPPSSPAQSAPQGASGGMAARPQVEQPYAPPSAAHHSASTAMASPAYGSAPTQRPQTKITPLVGFLVSYDHNENGEVFELRSGRIIVTSEEAGSPGASMLLIRDESVSPMHAILRVSPSGEIQVLDQLSEFGTKIRRFGGQDEEELSGEKGTIEHGDTISFGKRRYHVCLVCRSEEA